MRFDRRLLFPAVLSLGFALASPVAEAASGGSAPSPPAATPGLTPEQMAANSYNSGLKHIEHGDDLSEEAKGISDEKKRTKIEEKARKAYEKAIKASAEAIKRTPRMYQAHSSLGYAYRRTGAYDESLAAYDRALELEPRYTPAIEYRAEAYLGLNRLDDSKSAYLLLFNADRPRADELAEAMREWVEMRRQEPAGLQPDTIEEFATWLSQREELAQKTTSLIRPKSDW